MRPWKVDTTRWPIVVYSMAQGATDADVDAFIAEANQVLARREPWVAILDATGLSGASPHVRRRTVAWQKSNRALLQAHCLGTAYVLTSPLMRFISMTIMLITDLPTPYRICSTLDEALDWAQGQLRRGD